MYRLTILAFVLAALQTTPVVAVYPQYYPDPNNGRFEGVLTDGYISQGWKYVGCANELNNARALADFSFVSLLHMTVEACMAFCRSKNTKYAGVEYGQECYCGNNLASGSAVGQTGCTTRCAVNRKQFCGGDLRISVFQDMLYGVQPLPPPLKINTFQYLGCLKNPTNSRVLNAYTVPQSDNVQTLNTINFCTDRCYTAGYRYAAVENGNECRCDNVVSADATDANDPSGNPTCNIYCVNDHNQPCGGPNVVNLYQNVYY